MIAALIIFFTLLMVFNDVKPNCKHKFTKWVLTKGTYYQRRQCNNCGITQEKEV